jgi:hypothetical protein
MSAFWGMGRFTLRQPGEEVKHGAVPLSGFHCGLRMNPFLAPGTAK